MRRSRPGDRGFPEFVAPLTPCNAPVRRCPVPREAAARRILLMRYGAHGDLLMASPLLRALRDALPETPLVRSLGGEVVILPLVPGRSTTRLLQRIEQVAQDDE